MAARSTQLSPTARVRMPPLMTIDIAVQDPDGALSSRPFYIDAGRVLFQGTTGVGGEVVATVLKAPRAQLTVLGGPAPRVFMLRLEHGRPPG
jgi:hypothetical protein